jgi:oligosaccharide reducing-end xylanase
VIRKAAFCLLLTACGSTVDSVGDDASGPEMLPDSTALRPLTGPAAYPNAFRDVLGKTDTEIRNKIDAAFQRLFHGDPTSEAIYFVIGDDQAYIQDVLHGDVRSEGVGFGMMIAVQLDKREEFDRLWRFADAALEYASGPNRGYFRSSCESGGTSAPCVDPFGQQTLAMALLFAHGRWGSRSGKIDYGAHALRLLDVMLNKEAQNGGVVDGVVNMFDAARKLVLDVPSQSALGQTRPSSAMPAFYELWAQATGGAFWREAAPSARALLEAAAHTQTGLLPLRAYFDGRPVPGSDAFQPESFRAQLNMALDHIWSGSHAWYVTEADRLLAFFASQGMTTYCLSYTLDGSSCLGSPADAGFIAVNGATGMLATVSERTAFIEAAWNVEPPTGATRYYAGLLHLLSLLTLGGQFRVY